MSISATKSMIACCREDLDHMRADQFYTNCSVHFDEKVFTNKFRNRLKYTMQSPKLFSLVEGPSTSCINPLR